MPARAQADPTGGDDMSATTDTDDERERGKPTGEPPPEAADREPDPLAEIAKWKALARKHEDAAKRNEAAAKRLAEAEEADRTEVERERRKAADAEARAKAAELRAERLDVAVAKGLPVGLAHRLAGETRADLEADADELAKLMRPTESGAVGRERPRETLRSGAGSSGPPEDNDPTRLAALIPRGG